MTHLERPIKLWLTKDGTMTYGPIGPPTLIRPKAIRWAIPVYSVNTEEEARLLQVTVCNLQHVPHPVTGEPWYTLTYFSRQVEDLPKVTDKLDAIYQRLLAAKAEPSWSVVPGETDR